MKAWKKAILVVIVIMSVVLAVSRYYSIKNNFFYSLHNISSVQNRNQNLLEKYMLETGNTVKDWSQYGNDAVCLTGTNNFEGGERTEGTLKWNNSIEIPQLNQEQ